MAELHITEAELARDVYAVIEKVRQGIEIVIERDSRPVVVLRRVESPRRSLSELIQLAKNREEKRGYAVTLDEDFAADVRDIVRARRPWTPRSWD